MAPSGFASLVRDLMADRGMSMRALARQVPVDPGQLSRVLSGKRPASLALAEACDRVFGTGDLLTRTIRPAGRWSGMDDEDVDAVPRRLLLAGIAAVAAAAGLLDPPSPAGSRQAGRDDVTRIAAVTALYRSLDYEVGGEPLRNDVVRFAEGASRMAENPSSAAVASTLLSAAAAARQLAGWTCFDAGRHADAQRHFLFAERAALAAGDLLLAARIRYCQARQFQHLRHNQDALSTLRLARDQLGSQATPAVSAMLHGAEAASLAAVHDGPAAMEALRRASAAFDRIKVGSEPEWMRFYDEGELLAQHGRVFRDLARQNAAHADTAVSWSEQSIAAFAPQNVRSIALNEVGLCSALFLADEPERALATGRRVLAAAGSVGSQRVKDRIRNLQRDLGRHRRSPDVADFGRYLATA